MGLWDNVKKRLFGEKKNEELVMRYPLLLPFNGPWIAR